MGKKYRSSSNWEDSYFGGFYRILQDYPELKVPWEIDTETPNEIEEKYELFYYMKKKLFGLFQMKINEFNVINVFLANAKKIYRKNWLGRKKTFICPEKAQISYVLSYVADKDTELANLFLHYRELIEATTFLYPCKEEDEGSNSKDGDENEEGEEQSEGEDSSEGTDGEEGDEKKEPKSQEGKEQDEKKDNKEDKKGKGDKGEGDEGKDEKKQNKDEKKDKSKGNDTPTPNQLKAAEEMIQEISKKKSALVYTKVYGTSISIGGKIKESCIFRLIKKSYPCAYTMNEEIAANHLLRMLDISFDPEKDKVPNLRNGKLDTGKIGSVPAGNHHVYYQIEENQTTRPFSVCILCDESGSMRSQDRIEPQYSLVKILYRAFSQIVPTNKIYIYGHSGNNYPEVRIYNDNYNQVFEETINRQLDNKNSANYDGPVIEAVYDRVRASTSDNIIFITLSDGLPAGENYGGSPAIEGMKRIIEKCKRDGFVTVGVGMQVDYVKDIYPYHTIVDDMSKIASQVSVLVNQVVKLEFQD